MSGQQLQSTTRALQHLYRSVLGRKTVGAPDTRLLGDGTVLDTCLRNNGTVLEAGGTLEVDYRG